MTNHADKPGEKPAEKPEWQEVLDFWFPERLNPEFSPVEHRDYWLWRMRGGADEAIVARFAEETEKAARGALDHWADDPHGRLALILLLDQFPRSLWRDTPRAFAQDDRALALAMEGFSNGHYEALETPWEKTMLTIPLAHCEGPDHLERVDHAIALARDIEAEAPAYLKQAYAFIAGQPVEVRKVIEAFGRHPHRNAVLGRPSTPEEEAYIAAGRFPHLREPPDLHA
jgi:uncharacterized protein (DUF924 family)